MWKKRLKKIAVIISIVLVVLWFLSNLGIYLFFKTTFDAAHKKGIDYNSVPEKLRLASEDNAVELLPLMGVSLQLPIDKDEIGKITPMFSDNRLDRITIRVTNKDKLPLIFMSYFSDDLRSGAGSLVEKAKAFFSVLRYIFTDSVLASINYASLVKYDSFTDLEHTSLYARLEDLSWWNLIHNLRLSLLLRTKSMIHDDYGSISGSYRIYDLETPYMKGLLVEVQNKPRGSLIDFVFALDGQKHSLTFFSVRDSFKDEVRKTVASVQPVRDVQKIYQEMEKAYRNKESSRYPEELLLMSMISLKTPTVSDLKELLAVMERKQYAGFPIEHLKETIRDLEKK